GGQADLNAETLTAHFAPGGWLTRVEGAGGVQGLRRSGEEDDEFSAENAWLELQPRVGHPKELNLKGNVLLKTQAEHTGEARMLQTGELLVAFAEGTKGGGAKLLASGGWAQMDLQGDVRLKEGERSGQADHAVFVRATQTALLTGKALARDATTETQAPRISFAQTTGEIRAEGGVRSTDFSAKGSGAELAPAPANISADTMQANSKAGRAAYTGHARLWQGDSVMEA